MTLNPKNQSEHTTQFSTSIWYGWLKILFACTIDSGKDDGWVDDQEKIVLLMSYKNKQKEMP